MPESRSETPLAARALIDLYFERLASGDPAIADLLDEAIVWHTPASSPMQGPYAGKATVLGLMSAGVGLYDPDVPLDIEREVTVVEGDHAFAALCIRGRAASGAAYENQYVLMFRLAGGRIVEVREHLDTLYAQRLLFDPAGQSSPLDVPTDASRKADPAT